MRYVIFFTGILIGTLSAPPTADGQILAVEQTVLGMDCAPCAYALEKRLNNIDGVTQATVSLNKGLASVTLAADNRATLGALWQGIEDSGFAAREAHVKMVGTIRMEGGAPILSVSSGEEFLLKGADTALQGGVIVSGQTAPGSNERRPVLRVDHVEKSSSATPR